ncbi:hypothetical protein D3C85_1337750 [compost metagenome]
MTGGRRIATSSSFPKSDWIIASELVSRSEYRTPGTCAENCRRMSGTSSMAEIAVRPMPRCPTFSPRSAWVTICRARCSMSNSFPASARRTWPAGVSRTLRLLRSNSWAPICASSCLICRLSGGWVMFRRRAARVKLSSSARTRNEVSTRSSRGVYIYRSCISQIQK